MSQTAIVILNWNGLHYLERFLPVLLRRSYYPGAFVVVADNGSTDGSIAWLKEKHPKVGLIELGENYGYTGGYNKALAQIEADYYILLNSDVEVSDGWLAPLVSGMDANHEIGICMPKIRSHFEKTLMNINLDGKTIDFASYSGLGLCTMFNEMIKYGSLVHGIDYYMELDN